ncbi:MAG TPA: hypothetical protein VE980_14380 [Pyrinomonadaceae bacterium]|nr:hypothetical protein [Pyrinomonadaceae bacterium]
MKSAGRKSENSGYLVILLLAVALTAFSHSMKELTEIQQDASRLVAQWSGNLTPAEIPQTVVKIEKIEKLESCESSKQSAPSVELPWLDETPAVPSAVAPPRNRQLKTDKIEQRVIPMPGEAEIAKLRKLQHIDVNADAFEVRMPSVQFSEADGSGAADFSSFPFRAKARKAGAVKLNPRDREMILKTLNRSINLRIAS